MSFVVSIVTGIASAIGTVAGWVWQGLSGAANTAWSLIQNYIIPAINSLAAKVADIYSRINQVLNTVKGWIDKAIGEFWYALDALEQKLRSLLGAQIDKILKELGFREGLLKDWTKEWVISQLKPVWDTIAEVRGLVFDLNKKTVHGYRKAIDALEKWTSTQIEILGHKVNINIFNINRVLEELGFKEPPARVELVRKQIEEYPSIPEALVQAKEEAEKWEGYLPSVIDENVKIAELYYPIGRA